MSYKNKPKLLLIDGDILAYSASASMEQAIDWGGGFWTWHCEMGDVQSKLLSKLEEITETLGVPDYRLCLTDSEGNFRKRVLPTYKGHRKSMKKPLVLRPIEAWMIDELGAYWRPGLEGDDVIGILATSPSTLREWEPIIVSIDKDMKTIPAQYVWGINEAPMWIKEPEANWWWLYQTLTGDSTDGYKGCPGVGEKKAATLLPEARHVPSEAIPELWWGVVVPAYEKAGMGPEEALVQARVARILRYSDYDLKHKEPILWQPPAKPSTPPEPE